MATTEVDSIAADSSGSPRSLYAQALANVHKTRPRVEVDTWTSEGAAQYWLPNYQPTGSNRLPANLITGIVMRLFANFYQDVLVLRDLWRALTDYPEPLTEWAVGSSVMSASGFVSVVHSATAPEHASGNMYGESYSQNLCYNQMGYCDRKTCKPRMSWWRGCVSEGVFERLVEGNFLVRCDEAMLNGVGCLFTPLREALDTPYVLVRRDRSHVKKCYISINAAQALSVMQKIVPPLLSAPKFRAHVAARMPPFISALDTERLRFYGVVSMGFHTEHCLNEWDRRATQAVWSCGDRDSFYGDSDPDVLGVNYKVLESLAKTEPADLFPAFPSFS